MKPEQTIKQIKPYPAQPVEIMAIMQDCLLRDFILRRVGNIHLDEKKMMDLKELLSDLMRGRNYLFLKGCWRK